MSYTTLDLLKGDAHYLMLVKDHGIHWINLERKNYIFMFFLFQRHFKAFLWTFFMSSTNSEIVRSVVTDVVFYLVPIKLLLFKADDDVSSSSWVFPSVLGSSSPNQKIVPYTKNYFYCFRLRFWSFFFMHRIALDSFWGMVFNVFWHHVLFSQWTKNAKKNPHKDVQFRGTLGGHMFFLKRKTFFELL